jgi:signal transduction histidine kinase/ActR/RegA family two-component response regulator
MVSNTYPPGPLAPADQIWLDAHTKVGVGILMYDASGALLATNPRALELLDLRQSGPVARHADLIHLFYERGTDHDSLPLHLQGLVNPTARDDQVFVDFISRPTQPPILVNIIPLGDGRNLVMLFDLGPVITADDQDLSWQNHLMLQVIEHGPIGEMLFDNTHPDKPIIFVNRAFCDMTGQERAKILGTNWQKILPDIPCAGTYRVIRRNEDTPESLKVFGCQIMLQDNLGILMMTDITPLHQKEEQLRHIQKLDSLGQLAGGVAHDFNNILGIIRGYAHVLKGRLGSDDRMTNPIEHILSACARGAALSDKLLAFGRKKTSNAGETLIGQGLLQMAGMLKPLLPPNIRLSITGNTGNHTAILCNEDHFSQIIMNLLINARDAMVDGGLITIEAKTDGKDHALIRITDTGTGITPEVQKRLFEPYFTTKEVGKGTGLGLALVYGLMQQNNGEVTVESAPGKGSTFTLRFQAKISTKTSAQPLDGVENAAPHSLQQKTAMVVDDEEGLRDSLKLILGDCGMNILCAYDGDHALALQDEYEGKIDVLLSDVRMPNMNGQKLASLWREVRPESKIVMMSGYPDVDMAKELYDAFLAKPVDYEALVKLVGTLTQPANDPATPDKNIRSW